MKYFALLCLCIIIGCSSTKSVTKQDEQTDRKYDESFDPLVLQDDDIEFPAIVKNEKQKNVQGSNQSFPENRKEVNGFRVQIVATQNLEKATLLEEEAKSQFSINGHQTYLVFEAPLYKIRIGDFTSRDEAEELKIQALKYGYRESFIVRTKVNKKTSPDTY